MVNPGDFSPIGFGGPRATNVESNQANVGLPEVQTVCYYH
ncbi:hypothetical protein Lser_V15G35923 [Lactuca serriola]